jgi:UDP-glucose 4-epimerase
VILGAGGFIGINLANALAEAGYEVICFDRSQCAHWPIKAKTIVGEFANMPPELLAVLDDATVYHLVSSCRPSQHTETVADEIVADVATTIRYLEYTRTRNIRWVFVSSGGTVYGPNVSCPIQEDAPTHPICSYGLVKLTLENYFALYKQLHGTDCVVARVSNPYGPWQDPLRGQGIINALIYKALSGQTIEIWGDGENVRDYIYIEDAIEGLIAAACGISGEIYNISTGVGSSINQLTTIIRETLLVDISLQYKEDRGVDVRKNVLDSSKLSKTSDWFPRTTLINGIIKTSLWMKSII